MAINASCSYILVGFVGVGRRMLVKLDRGPSCCGVIDARSGVC